MNLQILPPKGILTNEDFIFLGILLVLLLIALIAKKNINKL